MADGHRTQIFLMFGSECMTLQRDIVLIFFSLRAKQTGWFALCEDFDSSLMRTRS